MKVAISDNGMYIWLVGMFVFFISLCLGHVFILPLTYGEPVVNLKEKDCSEILGLLGEDGKTRLKEILDLPDGFELPDYVKRKYDSILFNFENVLYLANEPALRECLK